MRFFDHSDHTATSGYWDRLVAYRDARGKPRAIIVRVYRGGVIEGFQTFLILDDGHDAVKVALDSDQLIRMGQDLIEIGMGMSGGRKEED